MMTTTSRDVFSGLAAAAYAVSSSSNITHKHARASNLRPPPFGALGDQPLRPESTRAASSRRSSYGGGGGGCAVEYMDATRPHDCPHSAHPTNLASPHRLLPLLLLLLLTCRPSCDRVTCQRRGCVVIDHVSHWCMRVCDAYLRPALYRNDDKKTSDQTRMSANESCFK